MNRPTTVRSSWFTVASGARAPSTLRPGSQLRAQHEAQAAPGLVDRADLGVHPPCRQQRLAEHVLGHVGGAPARTASARPLHRARRRQWRGDLGPGGARRLLPAGRRRRRRVGRAGALPHRVAESPSAAAKSAARRRWRTRHRRGRRALRQWRAGVARAGHAAPIRRSSAISMATRSSACWRAVAGRVGGDGGGHPGTVGHQAHAFQLPIAGRPPGRRRRPAAADVAGLDRRGERDHPDDPVDAVVAEPDGDDVRRAVGAEGGQRGEVTLVEERRHRFGQLRDGHAYSVAMRRGGCRPSSPAAPGSPWRSPRATNAITMIATMLVTGTAKCRRPSSRQGEDDDVAEQQPEHDPTIAAPYTDVMTLSHRTVMRTWERDIRTSAQQAGLPPSLVDGEQQREHDAEDGDDDRQARAGRRRTSGSGRRGRCASRRTRPSRDCSSPIP